MVAQAAHIPVHLGAMPRSVAAVIAREPGPGDVACSTTRSTAARTCPTSPGRAARATATRGLPRPGPTTPTSAGVPRLDAGELDGHAEG